ncbi:hypothetical protein RF11_09232 [Thelohanellus kitauei]|uniref:Uncharacterized protein n=1 Tax=Thelohanellus kitauei TaxID=669202 RepID=A0A0C2JPD0_THEKT|nr:hypothetical protein RF11_09232 [Thelohanellus kitauei]
MTENSIPHCILFSMSLKDGIGYWMLFKNLSIVTLYSPHIRISQLGFSTQTIGEAHYISSLRFLTGLIILATSSRSNSASTLGVKAYGSERGLNIFGRASGVSFMSVSYPEMAI